MNFAAWQPARRILCISSAAQLAGLAEVVNSGKSFEGKAISLVKEGDYDLTAYSDWTPIGDTQAHAFKGTFIGNDAIIQNLKITSGANGVGLFGWTLGPAVHDFTLNNANVQGGVSVGAIS